MQHRREDVAAAARAWIGTPYHHQASTIMAGCDCLGLVRGVFRTLYGREAEESPAYSKDWAETAGFETMLGAARRHLVEIAPAAAGPGDVVIFRFKNGVLAKHAAILATATSMIHATESAPVAEVPLSAWWRRRIAGAFSFPSMVL